MTTTSQEIPSVDIRLTMSYNGREAGEWHTGNSAAVDAATMLGELVDALWLNSDGTDDAQWIELRSRLSEPL